MKITYYGHSCFAAQIDNKTLLFDPFITGNELAKSIDVNKIPDDYILVSHGHSDHMGDAAAIARVAERIGPSIDQVTGAASANSAIIEHLGVRCGYLKPYEGGSRLAELDEILQGDLAGLSSRT